MKNKKLMLGLLVGVRYWHIHLTAVVSILWGQAFYNPQSNSTSPERCYPYQRLHYFAHDNIDLKLKT